MEGYDFESALKYVEFVEEQDKGHFFEKLVIHDSVKKRQGVLYPRALGRVRVILGIGV